MAARLFFLSLSGKENVEGRPETELLKEASARGRGRTYWKNISKSQRSNRHA